MKSHKNKIFTLENIAAIICSYKRSC